jgi:hypothetical protein
MSDWIDLSALWRIVLFAVVLGAGLPALFGFGLRLLTPADNRPRAVGSERAVTANPAAIAAAGLCFAVVLAAIGWGIYLIVAGT